MIWRIHTRAAVAVLFATLIAQSTASASKNNPWAAVNGSPASGGTTCFDCHIGPTGAGQIEILGAPSTYFSGGTFDLTVRVSDPIQVGAGFQISVEDDGGAHVGSIILTDPTNTEYNPNDGNWVNHTGTGVSNSEADWVSLGNAAEYDVQWQAPAGDVGPVTFWAVGVAINGNNNLTSDHVYATSTTAQFANVPAVSTWGIAILALAVATAGTIVVGRRRTSTG